MKKSLLLSLLMVFVTMSVFAAAPETPAPAPATEVKADAAAGGVWQTFFPQGLIDSQSKAVDLKALEGKIVALYFSAHWCPPCKAFSPVLVKFRDANSKDFEVVFVSADKDEAAQMEYMKEVNMSWPTVKFRSDAAEALVKKYSVEGIPTLIILNPKGEVITADGRAEVESAPDTCLAGWKAKAEGK